MLTRFRLIFMASSIVMALTLAMGPVGCAGAKARDHWWQLWRPKPIARASIHHPDRLILPPPQPESAEDLDRATAYGLFPPPPQPITELPDYPDPEPPRRPARGPVQEMQTIHFTYDSYELDASARRILDENLRWLLDHMKVPIQIEGHCDERGTVEYNLVLGERRAKAVKAYLVERGVWADLLHVISYGEERPLDPGRSDVAYARNRRAQFNVF